MCVFVRVRARASVRTCVRARVCVRACVRACACVRICIYSIDVSFAIAVQTYSAFVCYDM